MEVSELDGGEWSASRSTSCFVGERAPGTHWIGGWVGPIRSECGGEEKKNPFTPLPGINPRLSSP
jgi:hypothetical protein